MLQLHPKQNTNREQTAIDLYRLAYIRHNGSSRLRGSILFHPSISFPNKHDPAKLSQEYKTVKSTISSFIRIIRTPFGMSNFASINK